MYNAVIVDDEAYVRDGLRKHFDWQKYSIKLIGEAENGLQALRLLKENDVDILITDVKMPEMDGIALASEIVRTGMKTKIIFISGYGDVEYLRSALQYEAFDYILKTIDLNELEEAVKRVTDRINKERHHSMILEQMGAQLQESMPLLQARLLLTLIHDAIGSKAEKGVLKERMDFLKMDISDDHEYCVLVLFITNFLTLTQSMHERDKQLLLLAVLNEFKEQLHAYFPGHVFESRTGEICGIVDMQAMEEYEGPLLNVSAELRKRLKEKYDADIVMGISPKMPGIIHLKPSYQSALHAINGRFSLGRNTAVAIDRMVEETGQGEPDDPQMERRIVCALNSGDRQEATQLLRLLFAKLDGTDPGVQQNALFHLLLLPADNLKEYRSTAGTEYANLRLLCERFFQCGGLFEMRQFIENAYLSAIAAIETKRQNQPDKVIERVRQLIELNYAENLTIADIAEKVFLTPTYICLLFKQETGTTIKDYMTEIRISHAKKLLGDPKKKLYDVCLDVGYISPSYFTKVFKKHTGITPSEYRETLGFGELP